MLMAAVIKYSLEQVELKTIQLTFQLVSCSSYTSFIVSSAFSISCYLVEYKILIFLPFFSQRFRLICFGEVLTAVKKFAHRERVFLICN